MPTSGRLRQVQQLSKLWEPGSVIDSDRATRLQHEYSWAEFIQPVEVSVEGRAPGTEARMQCERQRPLHACPGHLRQGSTCVINCLDLPDEPLQSPAQYRERILKCHDRDRVNDVLARGPEMKGVAVVIRQVIPDLPNKFWHDHPIALHTAGKKVFVKREAPTGFGNYHGSLDRDLTARCLGFGKCGLEPERPLDFLLT
jgi:hypothetical protein